ncbi:ABC transporter substrate-binding protein [Candidatus Poriferisocius sp.]|uniref:ABC transporter substrate-binding protein n=1 Tax=Candidatus Poriferisocius sp. TaxID=3101276 RepID=UPI003B02BFD6
MSKSSILRPLRYWLVLLAALALVASSCGNDDDGPDAADPPAATEAPEEPAPATEEPEEPEPAPATEEPDEPEPAPATEEPDEPEPAPTEEPSTLVELGGGAAIDVAECPEEWDNYAGVTDTEIRFGSSLPRAGALAGFGTISDGIQLYFDNEEVGLIDGRRVVMVSRDDGYVPARTVTNVEEMIDVENLLGFAGILGSPNNLAVRDTLNENCIPQLFNLTGLPDWGDPTNYPWTTGGLMSYDTEARVWCRQISDELGEGTTAAVLSLGNDAGEAWRVAFNDCASESGIEVLDEIQHDPQADSVGSDVINLAASNAEVLIVASSGAFCPQAVASVASLPWEPMVFVANGCQSISLFWVPIGPLANGVRLVNTQKDVADTSMADDEWVRFVRDSLNAQGIDPEEASHALGYTFAEVLHQVLLAAAEMDGGVNRTNLMRAMWQVDFESRGAIGNSLRRLDGAIDSYMVEAGRVEELVVDADGARYVPVSDIISFEGDTGTFSP